MPFRILLALLTLSGAAAAASPDVVLDVSSYAYDIESTNAGSAYRTGRTLFGQQVACYGTWAVDDRARVGLGVFWTLRFGDELEALREGVEPYLFLELVDDGPSELRFGNLDRDRQALDPLLIDRVLRLDRPTDRGAAYRYENGAVRHDSWVQWRSRNTPEHRESFDVGVDTRLTLTPTLVAEVQGHLIHHGGELYDAGVVSDNWTGAAGLVWRPVLSDDVIGELAGHGYRSMERKGRDKGHGAALRAGLETRGWRVGVRRWWGDGFHAEDGHPYGLADDLTSWSVARSLIVNDAVTGEIAFVGHHLEGDFEQEFWLRLDLVGFSLR